MTIQELLEANFQGAACTKDCSGHSAGYAWSVKHRNRNCQSKSSSFNAGCNIAKKQIADKNIQKPDINNEPVDQENDQEVLKQNNY